MKPFDLSVFRRRPSGVPSLSEQFRARVEAERGSGTMRANSHAGLRVCIWTECDKPARREHMVAVREGVQPSFFFFCSDRHRQLWLHSVTDMGNLPSGSKGMIS